MSPWRDLVFLKIGGDARIEIIKSIPKKVQLKTCHITVKAVLRGRFIALQDYLKKQEKSQI